MNMDRYHHDHSTILEQIDTLRSLAQAGIADNAEHIGQAIVGTASLIKFHLAAEDQVLYPRLARSDVPGVAELSARYQVEMQGIAAAFSAFVTRWRVPARLQADPEGFRREDRELYPAAEQL